MVNGRLAMDRSTVRHVPSGGYLGSIGNAPAEVQQKLVGSGELVGKGQLRSSGVAGR